MAEPIYLRPTAALAPRVILPGDPGRALLLAQELIEGPKMFNHHRGLWGYSGTAHDGAPLTIQSTGMGAPSVAVVVGELLALGAERLVRLGTCTALHADLDLGEVLVPSEALAEDGTSRALGADGRAHPDPVLLGDLARAGVLGVVASYDVAPKHSTRSEARAFDLETAALLTLASRRGAAAAAVLIVAGTSVPARGRLDDDALADAARRAGHLVLRALA